MFRGGPSACACMFLQCHSAMPSVIITVRSSNIRFMALFTTDQGVCMVTSLSPTLSRSIFGGLSVCRCVCVCVCVRACLQSHSANPPLFVTVSSPWQHLLHYKLAACLETWISQGNRQMAGKCRGKLFLAYWDILSIL